MTAAPMIELWRGGMLESATAAPLEVDDLPYTAGPIQNHQSKRAITK